MSDNAHVENPSPDDEGPQETRALRTLPNGRYRGYRPAGEGGMGLVYWAIDSDLNREVAFKVVRPDAGPGSSDVPRRPTDLTPPRDRREDSRSFRSLKRRFLQEAWITSSMAHPGIVPVYELGQTEEGVPYYTMRFIGGERTLADAIDEARGSDPDDRLSLLEPFLKVCDAIRYAHSRGVIHRDLKPKNIALGDYGEVVLLDWGLARFSGSTDPEEDVRLRAHLDEYRATHDFASIVGALGTPGYMSPEALKGDGDAMDERSDVYSLGVMLFEILTGRLPFEFESFADLATRLLNESAPVASDVDAAVPPALSELCRRCLDRDPANRPGAAEEITAAIRRWQLDRERERKAEGYVREADLALAAARESTGAARIRELDRAISARGRLARLRPGDRENEELSETIARLRERGNRERDQATRRSLLKRVGGIALTGATVITVLVALLLDRERRDAELAHARETRQRARAEDLAAYMLEDLRDELQPIGRLDLLREVASKSLEYYDEAPAGTLTRNDRRARGLALGNIGDVLHDSGDLKAAERLFRDSLEIFEQLVAEEPGRREWRRDLSVGQNRLGDVMQETGRLDEALALYREALRSRRDLVDSPEAPPLARDDVARTLDRVGDVLVRRGEREEGLAMYSESLVLRRGLVSEQPEESRWWSQLAESLVKVGDIHAKSGGLTAALEDYERSRDILEQLLRETPESTKWKESLAGRQFRIAWIQEQRGEEERALEGYRTALVTYRQLGAVDPNHAWWQRNIALTLDRVADLVLEAGDRDTALGHYREAQRVRAAVYERDASNTRAAHDLAGSYARLGDFEKSGGDLAAARVSYDASLAIARALAEDEPENHEWQTDVTHALNRLGLLAVTEGNPEAGARHLREAIGIYRRLTRADPAQTEMRQNLGLNLLSLGDLERDRENLVAARNHYDESVEISRTLAASDRTNRTWQVGLVTILNRRADLASREDDPATRLRCHEEATEVNRRLLAERPGDGVRARDLSYNLYHAGLLHERAGHLAEALAALREAESLHRRATGLVKGYAAEHHFWSTAYSRVVMSIDESRLETPGDHLVRAYGLHATKRFGAAAAQFELALADPVLRSDLGRGHLYNAACAAALAGEVDRALAWLAEDLELRWAAIADLEQRLAAETDGARRTALENRAARHRQHFVHARTNDPDLELLRTREEFRKLFP